jgi:TIR domain
MATANSTTYDVFISHSTSDKDAARFVAQSLNSAGLTAFYLGALTDAKSISETIWEALSESLAVIALFASDVRNNANMMLEIGAASAWEKSIFVIVKGPESKPPIEILQKYPTYPLSRLDDVVLAIKSEIQPLTNEERKVLTDLYKKVAIPADKLSQSSESLGEISNEFRHITRRRYSSERLLSELLRLRKLGALPRLSPSQS